MLADDGLRTVGVTGGRGIAQREVLFVDVAGQDRLRAGQAAVALVVAEHRGAGAQEPTRLAACDERVVERAVEPLPFRQAPNAHRSGLVSLQSEEGDDHLLLPGLVGADDRAAPGVDLHQEAQLADLAGVARRQLRHAKATLSDLVDRMLGHQA